MVRDTERVRTSLMLLLLLGLLAAGPASAESRNGTIGDIIPLSGTAPGYDTVFLFMTGPGVPGGGSRMDSSVSPVVTGDPNTFTQVPLDREGRWSYSWQTGRVSGGLAAGRYLIYAATAPAAAGDLAGIPFSSTEIVLTRPVTTGTIHVDSLPPGAEVGVNGRYSGNTPLDLKGLPPGAYRITLTLRGYLPFTGTYNLSAGDLEEVSIELQPASPQTTSSPPPPTTTLGTVSPSASPSPTKTPLTGVPICGAICIGIGMSRRNARAREG